MDGREDMQNWRGNKKTNKQKKQQKTKHLNSVPTTSLDLKSKEYHVCPCATNSIKGGVNTAVTEGSYLTRLPQIMPVVSQQVNEIKLSDGDGTYEAHNVRARSLANILEEVPTLLVLV